MHGLSAYIPLRAAERINNKKEGAEVNEEIMLKVRAAKSPEELLKIAKENGLENFSEENAKAYFEAIHKTGELSDEELSNAGGGGGCIVYRSNGQKMVSIANSCSHWRCEACNPDKPRRINWTPRKTYVPESNLSKCNKAVNDPEGKYYHDGLCNSCYYCSYERAAWWCNNKEHYNE